MVVISYLFLAATAVSALLIPRDASTVLSDLKTLNTDFNTLTAADNQYAKDGNAVPVQNAVDAIIAQNNKTLLDAKASSPFSSADAQSIVNYITNPLEPSIKAAINATVANKAKVAAAGLSSAVAGELKQLKTQADDIASAIAARIPNKTQVWALNDAEKKIDADYDYGIGQFSS